MTSHEIIRSIYHNMPEASLNLLAGEMDKVSYPRGTQILKSGNVERSVFFVRKGIVRAFIEHESRQITFWFGMEGATVVSLKSYINGMPGYETIECIEDTSLYMLRRDVLERLFQEDVNIANWGRKFAETEFLKAEEKFIPMLFTTAGERYEALLKKQPELLRRVSQECLASYLGVTAQSLSRIRAGIR